jgi:hypothetical protein
MPEAGVSLNFEEAKWRSTFAGPYQCRGFGLLNPRGFLVIVGVGIIGMEIPGATFFGSVGAGRSRMRSQIISEGKMMCGVRRIGPEKMKLNDAGTRLITERAIASARDAKLAMPIVAECGNRCLLPVEFSQIGYQSPSEWGEGENFWNHYPR